MQLSANPVRSSSDSHEARREFCRKTFKLNESLRGARVLVMGASTDSGEQLAYHHARLGAQIVITTRRECMRYTRRTKAVSDGLTVCRREQQVMPT